MRQGVQFRPLALAAALGALALSACSGSGSPPPAGASPAAIVPASAAAYGELFVRPAGSLGSDAAVAARRVLGGRAPGPVLLHAIDANLHHHETYARDVEPWLGARLAAFAQLDGGAHPRPQFALLIDVRDRSALERELPRLRRNGEQRPGGAYRGVAYDVDTHDATWSGIVGSHYVGGSPAGFRGVVDTWKGGPSLAASARYRAAVAPLDPGRLALGYVDPRAVRAGSAALHSALLSRLLSAPALAKLKPVTATFTARPDALTLEVDAEGDRTTKLPASDGRGAIALGALPADAWLALATPPLGDAFTRAFVRGVGSVPGRAGAVTAALRRATRLDLQRDVLSWLGGAGLFVRGTNPLTLGGALVLGSRDPAASQRALVRLRNTLLTAHPGSVQPIRYDRASGFVVPLPGSPQPLFVLARGDRVVVAFGPASARAALDGGPRFDASDSGRAAIATLGRGFTPAFVLTVDPVLALVASTPVARAPGFAKALPYLKAYRSLALGYRQDGDRFSVRLVAGLRDPRSAPSPGGGTGGSGGRLTIGD